MNNFDSLNWIIFHLIWKSKRKKNYLKRSNFARNNFRKFSKFWVILRKLIPAKFLARMNSWKLILAKNTKQPNFQPSFKFKTMKKIQKHHFVCIVLSFLFKNPSKPKIITENVFFKNTYLRKIILAECFKEANSPEQILAKRKIFHFMKISAKITSFKVINLSNEIKETFNYALTKHSSHLIAIIYTKSFSREQSWSKYFIIQFNW